MPKTTYHNTAVESGFYKCGCGYEREIKCTQNGNNGLETIRRLHRKVCAIASMSTNPDATKHALVYELPRQKKPFKEHEIRKAQKEAGEDATRVGQ
jgi:hypothetical protein